MKNIGSLCCYICFPLKSLEIGPGHIKRVWENARQRLSREKEDDVSSQPESTPKVSIDESNTKRAFLGDQFQEMTYEEIAIWLDTRARYT